MSGLHRRQSPGSRSRDEARPGNTESTDEGATTPGEGSARQAACKHRKERAEPGWQTSLIDWVVSLLGMASARMLVDLIHQYTSAKL